MLVISVAIALLTPICIAKGTILKPETIILHAKVLPTAQPSPTPALELQEASASGETVKVVEPNQEIRELVKEVFGKHADKAFKVLSCENASLNPKAINTAGNTPKGSRDIGIFQISEYWQEANAKFLFDPRTNVTIAWQIYKDSGYTFKMWSCGKRLGI